MTLTEAAGSTRRRVLRSVVNVSVGAGLVWGVGADYAPTGGTVEIEYALERPPGDGGSVSPRTKAVPAEWYQSIETAFDVQRELREAGLSSIVGSFVVPGSFDAPSASVSVDTTTQSAGETVANIAEGVELDVTVLDELPPKPEAPPSPVEPFQVRELDRRSVPGGVHCESPEMSGSLAPAAFDAESDRRYFVTSNHVYGADGTKVTQHRDAPLTLRREDDTRVVGRVDRGYPSADFVLVDPVDGYTPIPEIAHARPSRVTGQFTRIGLADLMAREVPLQKVGAFSGHTEGQILGVDGFTCYLGEVCKPGQLKWGGDRTITDGDSGSTNFAPDPEHPEDAVIVGGINNARSWWPGADFTWGTSAFHLLDEYGIHF